MPLTPAQNYYNPFFQGGDPMEMIETTLQYPGQLGVSAWIKCDDGIWRKLMIVQHLSTGATTAAGEVAWWSDPANAIVTRVAATPGRGRVAGIYTAAVTASAYSAIVLQGRATDVKYLDSPTANPAATGLIAIPSATDGRADCLAAGSAATYPPIGVTIGTQDGTTKLASTDVCIWPQLV